jgi:hypothetical protein
LPLVDFIYADITAYRDLFFVASSEQVGNEVDVEGSPHSHAADWIMFKDPLGLSPNAPNLIQRYQMALFYFLTTNNGNKPWRSCNPPRGNETDECLYIAHEFDDLGDRTATRWLSGTHECEWIGIFCACDDGSDPLPEDDSNGDPYGVEYEPKDDNKTEGDNITVVRSLRNRHGYRPWLLRSARRNLCSNNITSLQVCKCTW